MSNKILMVLGMHRSGTSMIAQWLYRCGLHVGDRLLGPGKNNADGHFEDLDFVELHTKILQAHGLPESGLTDCAPRHLTDQEIEQIKELVESKKGQNDQWGWKDPRTCLFLETYRQMTGNDIKYLIVLRDYKIVIHSLFIRDFILFEKNVTKGFGRKRKFMWRMIKRNYYFKKLYKEKTAFYLRVWMRYNKALLQHIQAIDEDDFILINYQTLLNNQKSVYEYLTGNWSFNMNCFDFCKIYKDHLTTKKDEVDEFMKDKSLMQQANKLFNELTQYEFAVFEPAREAI